MLVLDFFRGILLLLLAQTSPGYLSELTTNVQSGLSQVSCLATHVSPKILVGFVDTNFKSILSCELVLHLA